MRGQRRDGTLFWMQVAGRLVDRTDEAKGTIWVIDDVDARHRAEDALKAASKRGHDMGRRERAQLGDGYRDRAERLVREAERASGLPEEKDYLERAKDDFSRAADYYRDIVPFAGSAASLRRVLDYSEHVETRLKVIREGA